MCSGRENVLDSGDLAKPRVDPSCSAVMIKRCIPERYSYDDLSSTGRGDTGLSNAPIPGDSPCALQEDMRVGKVVCVCVCVCCVLR